MRKFFIHLEVDGTLQRDEKGIFCEAPEASSCIGSATSAGNDCATMPI